MAQFSHNEVRPGDNVDINIQTEGPAKVGLAVVDHSVFILAENRLNLQQVFDELEKLYMQPQAELHEGSFLNQITTQGALETFNGAGVTVLTNKSVPQGQQFGGGREGGFGVAVGGMEFDAKGQLMQAPMGTPAPLPAAVPSATNSQSGSLADVQRVRQFFPETWLWTDVMTNAQGKATVPVQAPDSITTWDLSAVAMSKDKGFGMAGDQLKVFQPFFLTVDLPYAATRGEEFPVKVAVYNYLSETQTVTVDLAPADWFDLVDTGSKQINIQPNNVGSAQFNIKIKGLGVNQAKVTARSVQAADAVIKDIIVVPEGVSREVVDNIAVAAGNTYQANTAIPSDVVEGSGRAYIAITGSYLAQTIQGLDQLLQMPYGCGEQNMILFAPDVYITKYLEESGQLNPEVMAKAEKLMLTGYQRELIYRRGDGSFSAFGDNDKEGSLWLTAFVLKTFSQARGIIYIDQDVLDQARNWITSHQSADGSFESVGFVSHQELLGGVHGKTALTAYVAIALLEAGGTSASAKAVGYLEGQLGQTSDPYAMAITAYALELAGSARSNEAHDKLMSMAQEDQNGLHWGTIRPVGVEPTPTPAPKVGGIQPLRPGIMPPDRRQTSTDIENTAYALLALTEHQDSLNAGKTAKWLVAQRNAYGGYGSTQDTVVALQALTQYSSDVRSDVDLTLNIQTGSGARTVSVNQSNYDVLQVLDVPLNQNISIASSGKGQALVQVVRRFNLPVTPATGKVLDISVDYSADQVEVNDTIGVSVKMRYNLALSAYYRAEMVVLDVAVPTGFEPVRESLDAVLKANSSIKRYDIAARKVIFYVDDFSTGDTVAFQFQARALYPVRAQATASQAYSYYNPQQQGETQSQAVTVIAAAN